MAFVRIFLLNCVLTFPLHCAKGVQLIYGHELFYYNTPVRFIFSVHCIFCEIGGKKSLIQWYINEQRSRVIFWRVYTYINVILLLNRLWPELRCAQGKSCSLLCLVYKSRKQFLNTPSWVETIMLNLFVGDSDFRVRNSETESWNVMREQHWCALLCRVFSAPMSFHLSTRSWRGVAARRSIINTRWVSVCVVFLVWKLFSFT